MLRPMAAAVLPAVFAALGGPPSPAAPLLLAAGPMIGGDEPTGPATSGDYALLAAYLSLALVASFLCSLLEASFLSVPRPYAELLAKEGHRVGPRLLDMKQNVDRPLAAILTLNTIAHTVGAAGTGAMILKIFGNEWVALGSAVVTLLILVLSEIIPKSLGARYAKQLTPFMVRATFGVIILTWPIVIMLEGLSKFLGGGHAHAITRAEVASAAELGTQAGVLAEKESRVITNLLRLDKILVSDVMTPRPVALMVEDDETVSDVLDRSGGIPFSRLPVFHETPDEVIGLVLKHDLYDARHQGRLDATMRDLRKPIQVIPAVTSVARALEQFLARRVHMMLVVDEFGGTAGLLTLEDVVETLLGVEIVDETDDVADMRALARTRMERKRRTRLQDEAAAADARGTPGAEEPRPAAPAPKDPA